MDHYERLGVGRDVTQDQLDRAYRRLAALRHPDRNQDDVEAATLEMAAINEAYATLSDTVRKYDYDRGLDRSTSPGVTVRHHGGGSTQPTQPTPPAPSRAGAPDDDPVRRARREAKEREAAEAKRRGYRDPGGGFFSGRGRR